MNVRETRDVRSGVERASGGGAPRALSNVRETRDVRSGVERASGGGAPRVLGSVRETRDVRSGVERASGGGAPRARRELRSRLRFGPSGAQARRRRPALCELPLETVRSVRARFGLTPSPASRWVEFRDAANVVSVLSGRAAGAASASGGGAPRALKMCSNRCAASATVSC